MALRSRSNKDVKKSSYYVWYLGAREAKGVDAMPGAIDYLLERERLQEPFKVTLQVRISQPRVTVSPRWRMYEWDSTEAFSGSFTVEDFGIRYAFLGFFFFFTVLIYWALLWLIFFFSSLGKHS